MLNFNSVLMVSPILFYSFCLFVVINKSFQSFEDKKYSIKILSTPVSEEEELPPSHYTIHASNNKTFVCKYNGIDSSQETNPDFEQAHTHPKDIISQFNDKCVEFNTLNYWNYSICFGKNITQYHKEESGEIVGENFFVLGYYKSDKEWTNEELFQKSKSKHGDSHLQFYKDGDKCDKYNVRKESEIRFVCSKGSPLEIISQHEKVGCSYIFLVATSTLCQYPVFKPSNSREPELVECSQLLTKEEYAKYLHLRNLKKKITFSHIGSDKSNTYTNPDLGYSLMKTDHDKDTIFYVNNFVSASDEIEGVTKRIIFETQDGHTVLRWRFSYKDPIDYRLLFRKANEMKNGIKTSQDAFNLIWNLNNQKNFDLNFFESTLESSNDDSFNGDDIVEVTDQN